MPNGSVSVCGSGWWQISEREAFTRIDLVVGVGLLLLMASIMAPAMLKRPKSGGQRTNCTNNLKQVGLAFREWALDNADKFPMQVPVALGGTMELIGTGQAWIHFLVMSNELTTPKALWCPEERDQSRVCAASFVPDYNKYHPRVVSFTNNINLSYFVGVDATNTRPHMWLTGDANLKEGKSKIQPGLIALYRSTSIGWYDRRHGGWGNLVFADGNVQGVRSRDIAASLVATGDSTNRLAIP